MSSKATSGVKKVKRDGKSLRQYSLWRKKEDKEDALFSLYVKGYMAYNYACEKTVIWTSRNSYSTEAKRSHVYMKIREKSRMMPVNF